MLFTFDNMTRAIHILRTQGGGYLIFAYGCICRGRGSQENVRTQI